MKSSNVSKTSNNNDTPNKQLFLTELANFLKTRNKSISRIPTLGHKELDLQALYKEVLSRGGVEEVIRNKQWHNVVKALQLPSTCTNAAFALRTHYIKYLKDYESFQKGIPFEENSSSEVDQEAEDSASSIDEEIVFTRKKRKFEIDLDDQRETSKKYKMNALDVERLEDKNLQKYQRLYNLNTVTQQSGREDLLQAIFDHLAKQKVLEIQTITDFEETLAYDGN
eukprot:gene4894-8488_t